MRRRGVLCTCFRHCVLMALLLLRSVSAVEDEGLTVEDVTTSDEAENAKVPPRPKASDSEFRSKLFEGVDPSRIGETKTMSMEDLVATSAKETSRKTAADANKCGRNVRQNKCACASPADCPCAMQLECGKCLDNGCGWCVTSGRCVPDVPRQCNSPDEHVTANKEKNAWANLTACASQDVLKCEQCRGIAHQTASAIDRAMEHRGAKARVSELELLTLFETKVCVPDAYQGYGAAQDKATGTLVLVGEGLSNTLQAHPNTNNFGFKAHEMARRCREIIGGELAEDELYQAYNGFATTTQHNDLANLMCDHDCGKTSVKKKKKKNKGKGSKSKKGKNGKKKEL